MTEHFAIEVNKDNFKKNSKRLKKSILELVEEKLDNNSVYFGVVQNIFSLSNIQELQAKSLGFNNLNAINQFFDKHIEYNLEKDKAFNAHQSINNSFSNAEQNKKSSFLNNWTQEEVTRLFSVLLEHFITDKTQYQRAINFCSFIVSLAYSDKNSINTDNIRFYASYKTLFDLTRPKSDNLHKDDIIAHLSSCSYDLTVTYADTFVPVAENYLELTHITTVLNFLSQVEKNDALILSNDWWQAIFYAEDTYDNHIGTRNKGNDKVLKASPDSLTTIYSYFNSEVWNNLYNENTSAIKCNFDDKTYFFKGFSLINDIKTYQNIDDTWITETFFYELFKTYCKNKKLKNYRMSDLLLSICKVVNVKKKEDFRSFLINLLNNYKMVVEYSEDLQALANK